MVTGDGRQLARESKETGQIAKPEAKHKISPFSPPSRWSERGKRPYGLLTAFSHVLGMCLGLLRGAIRFSCSL